MGQEGDFLSWGRRESGAPRNQFPETQWTLVLHAIDAEENTRSFEALSRICEDYWYPLYAFVRREGANAEDALDEVQGFFAALLEKEFLDTVDRRKGRLRTFLLDALRKYRAKEFRAKRAQKRGGNVLHLSIDHETAEGRYEAEPTEELTPEQILDRNWALSLLEQTIRSLESSYREKGKGREFELLRPYLVPHGEEDAYSSVAAELGTSEANIRVKIHRLRKTYRDSLKDTVRQTLDPTVPASEIEDEFRHIAGAFS